MRYLLDTNILSNIAKPAPSDSLIAWMPGRSGPLYRFAHNR
jgi:toxin FitB